MLLGARFRWQIGVSGTEILGRSRESLEMGLRWQLGLSRATIWECKQKVQGVSGTEIWVPSGDQWSRGIQREGKRFPGALGVPGGVGQSLCGPHTHMSGSPVCPRPSSAPRHRAPGSRDLHRGRREQGVPGGLGPPEPPLDTTTPLGHSQLRLRALSTWISARNSLCRCKMSLQRMVSWKHSSGFLSMRTPPFRISEGGTGSGGSAWRSPAAPWGLLGRDLPLHGSTQSLGGILHGDTHTWTGTPRDLPPQTGAGSSQLQEQQPTYPSDPDTVSPPVRCLMPSWRSPGVPVGPALATTARAKRSWKSCVPRMMRRPCSSSPLTWFSAIST